MEGRQRGKSRRNMARGRRQRPKVWWIVILIIVAAVAAAFFFQRRMKAKGEERAAARDSSAAVEKEVFPGDEKQGSGGQKSPEQVGEDRPLTVEAALKRMTVEEKVLQLFMVTPEALTGVDEVYAAGSKTEESIDRYPVGGIVYFRQNLRSPEQVKDMLTRTQKYFRDRTGFEAFLAVDEEGGQVARISGREEFAVPSFPDMREIGASGEPKKAYEVGDRIGTYLSDLGFNMDFAPVADVLTNSGNTVVARRAFAADGAAAAAFSNEMVKGLKAHGVSAVLKHFPGHGGTADDSHDGYAATDRTLEELTAEDFVPFREGIDAGADFIMTGHIAAPAVTGDHTPASLSGKLTGEILRKTIGFDGIVITDALNMKAITSSYRSADAAVKALQAGNDMLLMPENFIEAYEGVLSAVEDGRLPEERIDRSVERILRVKLSQAGE